MPLACAVYDVTQPQTLEDLGSKWMRDFKEYGRQDAVQMVVGNKIDLVSAAVVLNLVHIHALTLAMFSKQPVAVCGCLL